MTGSAVRRPHWSERVLIGLIGLFVLVFTALASKIYDIFGTSAYDLGLFGQAFWLESRFLHDFNTIRGLHTLGDHLSLINYLFLPFNWLYFSIHWALLGQSLSVAVGAWYCKKVADHFLPTAPLLASLLAVSYLLNPLVHNTLLWQYHEVVMASGLYMFFIYNYLQKNFIGFTLAAILLLLCREDMPVTLLAFVPLALWEGRRREALVLAVLALGYWLFAFQVALPFYNGVGYFRDVYGPVAIAKFNLSHPDRWIPRLLSEDCFFYLFLVLGPLVGLSLASPLHLLAALPTLLFNVLVGGYYDHPAYHYSVNVMPFVYLAAARTLGRWMPVLEGGKSWPVPAASGVLLAVSLYFYAHHSAMTLSLWRVHWQDWQQLAPLREEMQRIDRQIGPEAGVAASDFLLPHLVQRQAVYLFPNPWKVHYWGINGESPHHPNQVDWILVAPDFHTEHYKALLDHLVEAGYFTLVQKHERFLLFRRLKPEKRD